MKSPANTTITTAHPIVDGKFSVIPVVAVALPEDDMEQGTQHIPMVTGTLIHSSRNVEGTQQIPMVSGTVIHSSRNDQELGPEKPRKRRAGAIAFSVVAAFSLIFFFLAYGPIKKMTSEDTSVESLSPTPAPINLTQARRPTSTSSPTVSPTHSPSASPSA